MAAGANMPCQETFTPVGGPPGQIDYLNAVAEVQTDLPAAELLHTLLAIEQRLGRERVERHGPRTIDLDLLLYGDEVISEPGLEVPHPRLHLRSFVLEPLAEIAPGVVHPTLGVTVGRLWEDFDPDALPEEKPEPEGAERTVRRHAATVAPRRAASEGGFRHVLVTPRDRATRR